MQNLAGVGGMGGRKSCVMGNLEVAYKYFFFSCKSTNQNQDIHRPENYKKICQTGKIKLEDDKQVKPVKAL